MALEQANRDSKLQLAKAIDSLNHKKTALEQLKASTNTINNRTENLHKEKSEINKKYDQIKNELLSLQNTQTISESEARKAEALLKEQIRRRMRERVDMEVSIVRSEILKGQKDVGMKEMGLLTKA